MNDLKVLSARDRGLGVTTVNYPARFFTSAMLTQHAQGLFRWLSEKVPIPYFSTTEASEKNRGGFMFRSFQHNCEMSERFALLWKIPKKSRVDNNGS